MKTRKVFLSLLLLFVATLSVHAYDFEVNGIAYNITSATDYTCSVTANSYSDSVSIPEMVSYNGTEYKVTGIETRAFDQNTSITAVSIPGTVASLPDYAFRGCTNLKTVSFEDASSSLTIGERLFYICPLDSVYIGRTITYSFRVYSSTDEYTPFYENKTLRAIHLSDNVKSIPEYFLYGCTGLKQIYGMKQITTVGEFAFFNCSGLTSLVFPNTLTEVGNYAFGRCTALAQVTIEDGSSSISLGYTRKTVGNVTMSASPFASCPLDSVYIGRNISSNLTFWEHSTLRSVYVSDSVSTIKKGLFSGCTNLQNVYGVNCVKEIGDEAFKKCKGLKCFVVPNSVTTLGSYVFQDCTSLEKLVVGDSITAIQRIIDGCSNLKTLYLGKGLQTFTNSSGGTTLEKVYLFTDKMTKIDTGSLKTNVFYVPTPEIYSTLLSAYNVQPIISFPDNTLAYTGKAPELSFKNNVEGMEATLGTSSLPKDVGTHSTTVRAEFEGMDWETSCDVPVTYTITPAPLTIQANNAQRYYGEENPELTCEYIGLKNGETSSVLTTQPTVYTNATSESNAGTYPIYCTGAEAKNYTITMQNGTLTINKVPQTITWEQDFTDVHVGDMIELTASCSSGLAVKYRSSDTSSVLITTKNGKQYAFILKVGYAAITAYQSGDANHEEADEVSLLVSATTTGIDNINANNDPNATYYNMSGQRIEKPASGLVIKRSADGSTQKVVVK